MGKITVIIGTRTRRELEVRTVESIMEERIQEGRKEGTKREGTKKEYQGRTKKLKPEIGKGRKENNKQRKLERRELCKGKEELGKSESVYEEGSGKEKDDA